MNNIFHRKSAGGAKKNLDISLFFAALCVLRAFAVKKEYP
jgi:hypothetical protein